MSRISTRRGRLTGNVVSPRSTCPFRSRGWLHSRLATISRPLDYPIRLSHDLRPFSRFVHFYQCILGFFFALGVSPCASPTLLPPQSHPPTPNAPCVLYRFIFRNKTFVNAIPTLVLRLWRSDTTESIFVLFAIKSAVFVLFPLVFIQLVDLYKRELFALS